MINPGPGGYNTKLQICPHSDVPHSVTNAQCLQSVLHCLATIIFLIQTKMSYSKAQLLLQEDCHCHLECTETNLFLWADDLRAPQFFRNKGCRNQELMIGNLFAETFQ